MKTVLIRAYPNDREFIEKQGRRWDRNNASVVAVLCEVLRALQKRKRKK